MTERGRPSSYKPENAELARKFCMLGATNDDLAACFEVAGGTIDYWIATHPEFAEAVRRGRDIADAAIVEKLYGRAMGYSIETRKYVLHRGEQRELPQILHYPPDVPACMFWLRNRRRKQWNERAPAAAESGLTLSELEAAAERAGRSPCRLRPSAGWSAKSPATGTIRMASSASPSRGASRGRRSRTRAAPKPGSARSSSSLARASSRPTRRRGSPSPRGTASASRRWSPGSCCGRCRPCPTRAAS